MDQRTDHFGKPSDGYIRYDPNTRFFCIGTMDSQNIRLDMSIRVFRLMLRDNGHLEHMGSDDTLDLLLFIFLNFIEYLIFFRIWSLQLLLLSLALQLLCIQTLHQKPD